MSCYKQNIALYLGITFRFGFILIIFIAIPAFVSCFKCLSCQCGTSSINNTYCSENASKEAFSCEKWAQCQTCRDNRTNCFSCPYKRKGPFCTEGVVEIPHGHREKKVSNSKSCRKRPILYSATIHVDLPVVGPLPSVEDTELPVGTRIFYSCYKGLILIGKAYQICENTGLWSGEEPTCIKEKQPAKCPDPGIPEGATRESVDGTDESVERIYLEGEALYFYCEDEDYVLEGALNINCTSFGNWSDKTPRCRLDEKNGCEGLTYCKNEGPIDHGGVQLSLKVNEYVKCLFDNQFPAGTVLHYSCDPGYVLEGASRQICQRDGYWSEEKPSCIEDSEVFCGHPGAIPNGTFEGKNQTRFPVGTTLTIRCRSGMRVEGNKSIYCLNAGKWSADAPICRPIRPGRNLLRRWFKDYKQDLDTYIETGEDIGKDCNLNAPGITFFHCTRQENNAVVCDVAWDGNLKGRYHCSLGIGWQPILPTFGALKDIGKDCNFNALRSSSFNCTRQENNVVVCDVTCDDNHKGRYYCSLGNRWQPNLPTCEASEEREILSCKKPEIVVNGMIENSGFEADQYPPGAELRYLCREGYEREGPEFIRCLSNLSWSEKPAVCKPISSTTEVIILCTPPEC